MIQIFLADERTDGRTNGPTEGSTRGPRGPKNISKVPERPSKTGRQLQSVAKQFGSIGKTASDITNRNINVQMVGAVCYNISIIKTLMSQHICSDE